jgi:hypothetical protein
MDDPTRGRRLARADAAGRNRGSMDRVAGEEGRKRGRDPALAGGVNGAGKGKGAELTRLSGSSCGTSPIAGARHTFRRDGRSGLAELPPSSQHSAALLNKLFNFLGPKLAVSSNLMYSTRCLGR